MTRTEARSEAGTVRICMVVPVFNHGVQAAGFVPMLRNAGVPLILVDDGSNAETADTLKSLSETDHGVTLIRHDVNQGKGSAVLSGFREARRLGFSHAFQIDGDGQHGLDRLNETLRLAQNHPTALIAGQPIFDETMPRHRFYARYITHIWVWIETLSFEIRDAMCGFRIYPLASTLELADRVRLGRGMDFDTDIMVRLKWAGVPIITIPVAVHYGGVGSSRFRPFKDNLLISWMHTRLFFGMILRLPRILGQRHG